MKYTKLYVGLEFTSGIHSKFRYKITEVKENLCVFITLNSGTKHSEYSVKEILDKFNRKDSWCTVDYKYEEEYQIF